jgi:CDGSH-type Zn-finger protein
MSKGEVAGNAPVGIELEGGKSYYWCACGKSGNQPWCDGSHKGTEHTPKVISIPETKTAWLCNCKQTNTPGFCDGSHKKL